MIIFRTWDGWQHDQSVMDHDDITYLRWATTCFYRIKWPGNDNIYQWAYCLNADKPSGLFEYEAASLPEWDGMSDSLKKKVNAIAYFGFLYPGHEDVRWHVATQTLIWYTVFGKHFDSRYDPEENRPDDDPLTDYDDVSGLEKEILRMVEEYDKISFSCEVYHEDGSKAELKDGKWEIQANEVAKVHVTSGNFNMMDIVKMPGNVILCDRNGNALDISDFDERTMGNDFYIKAKSVASGNISLNLILPTVVTKYLSFCCSVNSLYLNEFTGIAILV